LLYIFVFLLRHNPISFLSATRKNSEKINPGFAAFAKVKWDLRKKGRTRLLQP